MSIKIYTGDELGVAGRVLIGSTDKVLIRHSQGMVPPFPLAFGSTLKYQVHPVEIYFEGLRGSLANMSPDPLAPQPLPNPVGPLGRSSSDSDEIQRLTAVIACLVNMLGGSVTISPEEGENAIRKLDVEATELTDPSMLILRTKEK